MCLLLCLSGKLHVRLREPPTSPTGEESASPSRPPKTATPRQLMPQRAQTSLFGGTIFRKCAKNSGLSTQTCKSIPRGQSAAIKIYTYKKTATKSWCPLSSICIIKSRDFPLKVNFGGGGSSITVIPLLLIFMGCQSTLNQSLRREGINPNNSRAKVRNSRFKVR